MPVRPTTRIEDPSAPSQVPPQPSRFALFNSAFRPLFFLAGVFGVLSVPLWVGLYGGAVDLNLAVPMAVWHGHEMLYGYTLAAIGGFFLTVVPNWTRAKAQKGPALMVLSGVWVLGRIAVWAQGGLPYTVVFVADMAFVVMFSGLVLRPLLDPQYRRQMVFVPILATLVIGNAMSHMGGLGWGDLGGGGVDWATQGLTLGLDGIVVLITVMGGRVTPSFTSSYLGHANPAIKVRQSAKLDRLVLNATWALLVFDQILPGRSVTGALALIVAILHGVRLAGWLGWRTWRNPILCVLHVGYAWLVVGLALRGLGDFGLLAPQNALHALTIGAIGTYTMGIMTRASLGHTGRVVKAAPVIVAAYVLISVAALSRLLVAPLPEYAAVLVMASGVAWTLAFTAFFVVYAPILMRPRPDGRPG